jgi:protein-tyrosine phosphatase
MSETEEPARAGAAAQVAAIRDSLRAVRNAARAAVERAAHPGRRRRARRRLERRRLRSVLFVCEGNIYRSPFAAACFMTFAAESRRPGMRIASAGFVGPGRPSPGDAQAEARTRGIDLSAHRSAVLDGAKLNEWDLVVVMEARQARALRSHFGVSADRLLVLGDLDPGSIDGRSIADPWQSPGTVLGPSYQRVERCVRALVAVLAVAAPTSAAASTRLTASSWPEPPSRESSP